MNKKTILGALAALSVALVVAWFFFRADPALAELNKIRDEIQKNEGPPTQEQRAAMRAEMENLTDAQRRKFWEQNRPQMQERMTARFNEFMARPPEQIRNELAERVISGRAERAQRDANGEGRGEGNRGDRPQRTEAERDQRSKERLDRFPAEGRAQFGQLRGMVNKELEARGEEPLSRRDMRDVFGAIMGEEGGRGGPGGGPGRGGPGGGPPR